MPTCDIIANFLVNYGKILRKVQYFYLMRGLFLFLCLLLGACQPADVNTIEDTHDKRTGLAYGKVHIIPPSDTDNAKIQLNGDVVILAKAHVMGIKSELYQPSFRLEGKLESAKIIDAKLPTTSSLESVFVAVGDDVKKGDKLALFYQYTPIPQPTEEPNQKDGTDTRDEVVLSENDSQDSNKDTNDDSDDEITHQTTVVARYDAYPVVVFSPINGKIHHIKNTQKQTTYPADTPIFTLIDDTKLKFTSPLPTEYKDHLGIGKAVNFSTDDGRRFTGQIEQIAHQTDHLLAIHVAISPEEIKKAKLTLGEYASGYVEYGQNSVGVLVPEFAIFDKNLNPIDTTALQSPPYKPATPIHAFIWTVGQNGKLALSPIELIEYRPKSDYYLVNGVDLTGLIVLADLPKTAIGKSVQLK